jgi:predicted transcriptional regulator
MSKPEGSLTSAQYEILEVVWARGADGATVAEVWDQIAARRPVGRTTILNLVDRLEKRGWLVRRPGEKPARYTVALDRESTTAFLAGNFVDDFFRGSARDLVMSLLGSQRLKPEEIEAVRTVLESASRKAGQKKGK